MNSATSATMLRGVAVALSVPVLALACGRVKSDASHAGAVSGNGGADANGGTSAAVADGASAGTSQRGPSETDWERSWLRRRMQGLEQQVSS